MTLETSNHYKLAFKGLEEGNHTFNMLIGVEFIELFGIEHLQDIGVRVSIKMIKRGTMLEMHIEGRGKVVVACDRCLEPYDQPVAFDNDLIVKTNAIKTEMIDENLIHLSPQTDLLELGQYLYESLIVSLPIKMVHPAGKCNKEMTDRLKPNKDKQKKSTSDPRWDALKNIKF